MNKNRQCIFCGIPLSECFGSTLPRDALLMLEGKWDFETMGWPRELCNTNFSCAKKWQEQLQKEDPERDHNWI